MVKVGVYKVNSTAAFAETPKGKGNQWIRLIGAIKSHFPLTIFSHYAVNDDVAYALRSFMEKPPICRILIKIRWIAQLV